MEQSRGIEPAPPFAAAAAALEAGTPPAALPPAVAALLAGFALGEEGATVAAADAALLRVGARCGPLFRLPAPDAPGLVALGATVDLAAAAGEPPGALPPASAAGAGATPRAALRACLGEAAELLATVETAADRARMRDTPPRDAAPDAALAALLAALPWPEGGMRSGWLPGTRMNDGATLWLPRELVLRAPPARRAFAPPWPLSTGCGAGTVAEEAALRGLLELVERDAVTLWWQGGLAPRAIALEDPAQARAAALLARLRGPRSEARRSWLLDITADDLGVPVVAAVSFAPDGGGFCCGFAARAGGLAAAAEAAVLELLQMELGQALAAAKARLHGPAALNARDRAHLARQRRIHAAHCPQVHPARPAAAWQAGDRSRPALPPEAAPAAEALAALLLRLGAAGLAPIRIDLGGRPGAGHGARVPVVRMLCPGLAIDPAAAPPQARLRRTRARAAGGQRAAVPVGLI